MGVIESIPLGIVVTDLDGTIQTVNSRAESIINGLRLVRPHQHINALFGDQEMIPLRDFFRSGCASELTLIKVVINGMMLEVVGAPLKGDKGVIRGAVFTLRDVSEAEARQELEKKSEKDNAIGEISADLAHEIRNPLGSIELFASLLKKELKRKKDINRVNQIISAVKNMDEKIRELILSNKTSQIPVEQVNVHDILKDIMLFSERIIDQEAVFLSIRYATVQPVIECNPDLIKQVFLNLILKALQTIREPGRLDILTSYLPELGVIEIHFIENSPCAREKACLKIFDDPLPSRERSSGLDLAIIHNIVNMYKGSIRIEYVRDIGTAFIISFPVVCAEMRENRGDEHNNLNTKRVR